MDMAIAARLPRCKNDLRVIDRVTPPTDDSGVVTGVESRWNARKLFRAKSRGHAVHSHARGFVKLDFTLCYFCFSPVLGSRMSVPLLRIFLKLNMLVIEPAIASNEPPPILCPPSQLSSMKRITELWSVTVWSTKFFLAHGEITRNGSLGP